MHTADLEKLAPKVRAVLQKVAEYQRKMQGNVTATWKGEGDTRTPVTEVDVESQRMLEEGLAPLVPGSLFRGEESEWSSWPDDAYCWVVDPLDGTHSYIQKRHGWAISVALLLGDELMLGFIVDPENDVYYSAVKGGGAYKDGERIHVTYTRSMKNAKILASEQMIPVMKAIPKENALHRAVKFHVGATIKCALIAAGEADGYFHVPTKRKPKVWDIAAGVLLVHEAKGASSMLTGAPIRFNIDDPDYDGYVLANPDLLEEFRSIVAEASQNL